MGPEAVSVDSGPRRSVGPGSRDRDSTFEVTGDYERLMFKKHLGNEPAAQQEGSGRCDGVGAQRVVAEPAGGCRGPRGMSAEGTAGDQGRD